jgi:cellulase/cellobiase CelA1
MNTWMYALDARDGRVLWQFQGAGSANAGPAIVAGRVYWGNGYSRGGTASTRFYSFRLPGGQSPSPTAPSPTASPTVSPTSAPNAPCTATYRVVGQWPGGFQAEMTVRAGTAPVNGWTVRWAFGNGQAITQIWNATATTTGATVTARNLSYNGSLPPNASTTFGFLGSWNTTNTAPAAVTCASP